MTSSATILAVEDEEAIRQMLTFSLERNGYTVIAVSSVPAAKKVLTEAKIDLALVDWMLPGGTGLEFVRSLRKDAQTRNLPVIMLTARTEEDDISAGLDAGADDYVKKPFSPKELNSRINALLRRSQTPKSDDPAASEGSADAALIVGPLQLNSHTHRAYVIHDWTENDQLGMPRPDTNQTERRQIELGHTEFKLLRFFMENPERVYSRTQLLDHVWGTGTFIEERTVDVHILRLRKNLKPAGADKMLETVRGAGYRLSVNTLPHASQ